MPRAGQDAVALAVLGDVDDPGVEPVGGGASREVDAVEDERPGAARHPVSASASSTWPLPATPAMPRISPRCR